MSAGAEVHRASTSLDRDATCLAPQFDIHVRIVEHAYLGFFRERSVSIALLDLSSYMLTLFTEKGSRKSSQLAREKSMELLFVGSFPVPVASILCGNCIKKQKGSTPTLTRVSDHVL